MSAGARRGRQPVGAAVVVVVGGGSQRGRQSGAAGGHVRPNLRSYYSQLLHCNVIVYPSDPRLCQLRFVIFIYIVFILSHENFGNKTL
jgi:hypothetical protein